MAEVLPSQTADGACFRCGTPFDEEHSLPTGALYCRACLLLGRVRTDEELYTFAAQPLDTTKSLRWTGELTPWQERVSKGLSEAVQQQATLVHAVTGAGKTEMMYQTVASCLDSGGRVCLASPRIDVCLELYQRLSRDFSCPVSILYGGSEEDGGSPLVVATTHQLLKFYQAFDLLLIDEVDAFPYVDNPMLYHAVEQACTPDGVRVFLTATSTDELDRQVKKGSLHKLHLPRRFHGNPLVLPKKIWSDHLPKALAKGRLPRVLQKHLLRQRQTGYPLLLFAPEIELGQSLAKVLQDYFPQEKVGFVSSQTDNRLELVTQFRQKELTILVSTTILERGVTFPCVDVFVVEAHHRLFTSSSLIQIGGRVGRSFERPTGELLFFHRGTTRSIEKAITEIAQMNREAGL